MVEDKEQIEKELISYFKTLQASKCSIVWKWKANLFVNNPQHGWKGYSQ